MPRREYIHPDEACKRLGIVARPDEGVWAKYDRRRKLKELGLKRYTGPFKGYRYDAGEVDRMAEELINVAA